MRLVNSVTRFLWSLIALVGTLGLVGYLAFVGWQQFGPRKPLVNAVRRELAELVLPVVVDDLRIERTNASSAVFLHLAGDPSDHVTDRLRALLTESGALTLTEPTLDEKLQRALNLQVTSPATLDSAVARARGLGAPAVLYGVVHQFDGTPQAGRLSLELTLADLATREVLFTRTYTREWKPLPLEPAVLEDRLGRMGAVSRLLGWTLVVLLLPVFTIGFLRATVRKGSNRANVSILSLYTLVAAILAWLVVGATLTSVWSALWLMVLTGLAFAYHVWIMTVAVRLEDN